MKSGIFHINTVEVTDRYTAPSKVSVSPLFDLGPSLSAESSCD